ncbi:hypothetical protein BKA67DRAFT_539662 [Truncatella angustata]|uniref:Glucose-methanol-choline oxidoreductase N-terminal domain-containing protein n=1 Tax=Truncatella angustata TaxID=152316 RepID=A0A9P8RL40_9PEZI|nr:uncharacterized protein BKA67DRAFT_539662 [Truncatella angustata]KAH6647821.1 hypothetical protein BKA67DRAFT_539662 [Truncatella angustata]KAH8202044.1 hypothetical protein TruAng_003799 [Truncatella angustata]
MSLKLLLQLAAATAAAVEVTATTQADFDYIIIGGGTSGLTVANRLSEDSSVSVLVIEAGGSVLDNKNVTDVDGYGLAFGTDIDWAYESVNQTYGGNTRKVLRAGKALAGTSAINGMAYTRAEDIQIDAWETIGNEGWTWESLLPYYLKSENLTRPTQDQTSKGASYNTDLHGTDGDLKVGFTDIPANNLTATLNQTMMGLGVPWTEDVNGGKMRGFNVYPSTIDYENYVREDAARAYYWPFATRENLQVLNNTFVNRLVWANGCGDAKATGVEVTLSNGTIITINTRREVIISAGALKSSGILELSGVGNPSILQQNNISVRVNLPAVGENLQDQANTDLSATSLANVTGTKTVVYPNIYDIFGNDTESLRQRLSDQLQQYAADTASANNGVMSATDLESLYQVQLDLIFTGKAPVAEILFYPGGGATLASEYWSLLPFSRGSVHIGASEPTAMPVINPNYFMLEFDMEVHAAIAQYVREIFQASPLKDIIQEETLPGQSVPQAATNEDWKQWILNGNYRSNFHPVGTAAMMPRSIGGVVNEQFQVYGTKNVRVVDASVLPYQVCGHLTSTLYAISERAADFIKATSS